MGSLHDVHKGVLLVRLDVIYIRITTSGVMQVMYATYIIIPNRIRLKNKAFAGSALWRISQVVLLFGVVNWTNVFNMKLAFYSIMIASDHD